MDHQRLIPMRHCPTCNAMIFLNSVTDEMVYTCVCLEQSASIVEGIQRVHEEQSV
jgi:hypothetical protein